MEAQLDLRERGSQQVVTLMEKPPDWPRPPSPTRTTKPRKTWRPLMESGPRACLPLLSETLMSDGRVGRRHETTVTTRFAGKARGFHQRAERRGGERVRCLCSFTLRYLNVARPYRLPF
ncbi:hypothetical protein SKAU_G00015020 [Synaphobranchus kaupii]|uniref:Uncharacterized protein n=1 Tax=Synaphobranchus kaupii TaxID=118154 RepID=A0A9Q1GC03_SYNKA|nr:hypothetical protein SKAU_G00015020 [Synaphobranchus kaupii]